MPSGESLTFIESPEANFDLKTDLVAKAQEQSDGDAKVEILRKLPDDLQTYLTAEIKNAHFEYAERIRKGLRASPVDEKKVIAGTIFELFVQNDPEITGSAGFSPLNERMVNVAHDSERYGLLEAFGKHYQNSDAAFFEMTEEGVVIFHAFGEAKMGLLRERSVRQMGSEGSRLGVEKMVEVVNGLLRPEPPLTRDEVLNQHGLLEVMGATTAKVHVTEIRVADEGLKQILILPADRVLPDMEMLSHVKTQADLVSPDYKRAVEAARGLLSEHGDKLGNLRKNNKFVLDFITSLQGVELRKSRFSIDDVYELANVAYARIVETEEWQANYADRHQEAENLIVEALGNLGETDAPEKTINYVKWLKSHLESAAPISETEPLEDISPRDQPGIRTKIYRHAITGIEGSDPKESKYAKSDARRQLEDHLAVWKTYLQQRNGKIDLDKLTEAAVVELLTRSQDR